MTIYRYRKGSGRRLNVVKYTPRGSYLPYYKRGSYSNMWRSTARATYNALAAKQQRDSTTVTINRIATAAVTIPSGQTNGVVILNHWDSLRQSQFFPNYAPMYDQMKIDAITIKVTGSQMGTATTPRANLVPAVILAFDRNGLSVGQVLTSSTVSTYSSAQLKNWSLGNSFVMRQTIYPSTMAEKSQYIPTESLVDPTADTSAGNPCTNLSSPLLAFKPITLLGADVGMITASADVPMQFAFTVEYEYTVTFRGMRKPALNA